MLVIALTVAIILFLVIVGKISIKENPKKDAVVKEVKKLGLIAGGTGK